MTTAKKNATTTKTATTPAQVSPNQLVPQGENQPAGGGYTIHFAKPKAERQKSDRAYCDHVDSKGKRCSLRVMSGEGRTKCVNHVPAEEKLTEDEAKGLLTLVGGLDETQQIRMLTRAIGWYKVKQLVSGKPEGDLVLNELVG